MVREEADREDLMAEATALVERAELSLPGSPENVVVGFRRDGSWSVFFGADPVYQFNSAGELRRAYVGGLLFKADRGRLVSLRRQRADGEVQLLQHRLSDGEMGEFLRQATERLTALADSLRDSAYNLVAVISADADVTGKSLSFVDAIRNPPTIAASPRTR